MNVTILLTELKFNTSRSGGKGGQHVNKTESKVELIFDLAESEALSEEEKELLSKNLKSKLTGQKIHITAQTSRSQIKNKEAAIKKLIELLKKGLIKPKARKATKPSKAVKAKIRKDKEHRKEIKAGRRKIY